VRDFRELKVWSKAHQLVLDVYRATRSFPADERFGLTAHIRKSAGSIPSNIAEGCGRQTEKDFARFLSIAAGSTSETEYQLKLAHDLGFLEEAPFQQLVSDANEVKKMLNSLVKKIHQTPPE
jgi:four helix bundle protein